MYVSDIHSFFMTLTYCFYAPSTDCCVGRSSTRLLSLYGCQSVLSVPFWFSSFGMVGFYTVIIVSYCCLLPLAPLRSMCGLVLFVLCVSGSLPGLLVPAGHGGSTILRKFATNRTQRPSDLYHNTLTTVLPQSPLLV